MLLSIETVCVALFGGQTAKSNIITTCSSVLPSSVECSVDFFDRLQAASNTVLVSSACNKVLLSSVDSKLHVIKVLSSVDSKQHVTECCYLQ